MKFQGTFIKAIIPIISIVLALAGMVQLRGGSSIVGAVCLILAITSFVISIQLLEKRPITPEELETQDPTLAKRVLWVIVIGLITVSVLYVADNLKSVETDRIAVMAWVCAMIVGLILTWWDTTRLIFTNKFSLLRDQIRTNRGEFLALALVMAAAFLLRTISLSAHPYPWSGDEASIGMEARRILSGEVTNFFDTGWSSQPNWSFVPAVITEIIFGQNILAIRLTSAVTGTLAVLFVYLTARVLFNPAIGLMAGAFLATLPYNVHFSRLGVHNILDSLVSSMIFWLIAKAIKDDNPRFYYTAGVIGGLSIYTYAGTRLALILGVITILFVIIRRRGYMFSHWKLLLTFAFGLVLSIAPQAAFFARHPNVFLGRMGQEGILFNGWLARRAIETGQSQLDILIDQFSRTTMVFIASPAPGNFFNSPEPYLTIIGSTMFLFGMGYALVHLFETKYFILLLWFWAVVLFGGVLTLNPPANTRLLMTSPPVVIYMALGTFKIIEYLQQFRIIRERAIILAFLVVVLVISYQNINFYMGEYRQNMYFENANGELAMEAALMTKELGEIDTFYLLGSPRIFSVFPTLPFLLPQSPRQDLTAEDIETLSVPPDQRVAFFAIPENRILIEELSQKFPGGQRGLMYRKPRPNEILLEYYILNP